MKTFDPHSLLTVPRIIENHEIIFDVFNVWKTLMKEKTDSEINEFDAFLAGFFLGTNQTLREKYLKLKDEVYYVKQ